MSSVYTEMRSALQGRLNSLSGLPDVAWENIVFKPTTGTPFVSTLVIPTKRSPAVAGANPSQRYDGIFRVDVIYPEGNGPKDADEMADSIIEHMDASIDIVTPGVTVRIDSATRGQGVVDSPWYIIPVSINFYAYKV